MSCLDTGMNGIGSCLRGVTRKGTPPGDNVLLGPGARYGLSPRLIFYIFKKGKHLGGIVYNSGGYKLYAWIGNRCYSWRTYRDGPCEKRRMAMITFSLELFGYRPDFDDYVYLHVRLFRLRFTISKSNIGYRFFYYGVSLSLSYDKKLEFWYCPKRKRFKRRFVFLKNHVPFIGDDKYCPDDYACYDKERLP